jgi:hypothetical protein
VRGGAQRACLKVDATALARGQRLLYGGTMKEKQYNLRKHQFHIGKTYNKRVGMGLEAPAPHRKDTYESMIRQQSGHGVVGDGGGGETDRASLAGPAYQLPLDVGQKVPHDTLVPGVARTKHLQQRMALADDGRCGRHATRARVLQGRQQGRDRLSHVQVPQDPLCGCLWSPALA